MKRYAYKGRSYTINELSEMSGVKCHTLRDRLRRGYSIEQAIRPMPILDSVVDFCEASYWKDWLGKSISEVYTIYWKWCLSNGYDCATKTSFGRQVQTLYPHLKTVPTANASGCNRIIRVRSVDG